MISPWPVKRLGDVCDVIGGGTPSKDKEHYFKGNIPWATVRDMRRDIISETEFCITNEAVESSSTNLIPAESVVIATRVGLGKVCFVRRDTAINQDLRGIIPMRKNELSVHYLFWWFKSVANLIVDEGTGATVQGVKLPFIKSLPIPVPPLPEQKRIVAILDKVFEGIATATANAEKNLANARELFDGYLNSVFMTQGKKWKIVKLGDVSKFENGDRGKNYPGRKAFVEQGIPFINAGHLNESGIDMEAMDFIPELHFDRLSNGKIKNGDVLFCLRGSLGKFAIAEGINKGAIASSLVIVRPTDSLERHFLGAFFGSTLCKDMINKFRNGAAQPNLSAASLRLFTLPLPPLTDQKRIVSSLREIRQETQNLKAVIHKRLSHLANLKQSILRQAFAGELSALSEETLRDAAD